MPFADNLEESELAAPASTLLQTLTAPRSAVVVGRPGSGKTLLAIHLARKAAETGRVQFIVASEHLVEWITSAIEDPAVEVKTWRTWLKETYRAVKGRNYPVISASGLRTVDWDTVFKEIKDAPPARAHQVMVDEAQDVPFRLLSLIALHTGNLVAFADPLQRHASDGSTVEQLIGALDTEHPWPVFVLEEDFRTTWEIQRFATAAWAPERSDPSRPSRNAGEPPQVLEGDFDVVAQEAQRLMGISADGRGVAIASSHADRARVAAALTSARLAMNRGTEADPNKISVLAYEALRGLEFDGVVVVPPAEPLGTWPETASDLYVASTRPRRSLSYVLVHRPFAELTAGLQRAARALENV